VHATEPKILGNL